jgi:3-methyladenine DNA glycosylase/8-oxoguanine DNA glycosylase
MVETALPVDLVATLAPLWHGRGDPCMSAGRAEVWRASWFASGAATTHLRAAGPRRVEVRAWGPGAEEALEAAPDLVGARDDDGGLARCDDTVVRRMARSRPALRLCRGGNVLEVLVPAVLEQKVQGARARAAYRSMVRAFGTPAPAAPVLLLLPPTAEWLREQPSWRWHRWGVELRRATTVRTAAASAGRCTTARQLRALPGIGVWTAAQVASAAWGDADAVSVGDYWLKHWVCHTLAGEPRGTDERMLELLEPWAGQRGRVCRLIMSAGVAPPRYGPRLPMADIRAI